MNLPENVSTTANRLFSLLSTSQSPVTIAQLTEAFARQPAAEERHKAIATANSLAVKGIIGTEKDNNDSSQNVYTLLKSSSEVGPDDEADAKEDYAQKSDVNAEEARMIGILEQHDKKLPETTLFDLYEKEQLPADPESSAAAETTQQIEAALKELTDAGVVIMEGETYRLQQ